MFLGDNCALGEQRRCAAGSGVSCERANGYRGESR